MNSERDDPLDWYLVQTEPQCEFKALANLRRQGFAAYLPICVTLAALRHVKGQRKHQPHISPAFPRYAFCGVPAPLFEAIRNTVGVSAIVEMESGVPFRLRQANIDDIRQREQGGFFDANERVRPSIVFHIGDEILLTMGLGIDRPAKVERVRGNAVVVDSPLGRIVAGVDRIRKSA